MLRGLFVVHESLLPEFLLHLTCGMKFSIVMIVWCKFLPNWHVCAGTGSAAARSRFGGPVMKKSRSFGYSRWRWRSGGYMLLGLVLILVAAVKLQDTVRARDYKASLIQIRDPLKPKLAFLFLARHVMPLDILWEQFFEVSLVKLCCFIRK